MENVNEFIERNGLTIHLFGSEDRGFTCQLIIEKDSSLLPDPRQVDKCWGPYSSDSPFPYYFLDSTGKPSPTKEGSILNLEKDVLTRIKRFEKHGDLRPSQVRKLDLLKKFIG